MNWNLYLFTLIAVTFSLDAVHSQATLTVESQTPTFGETYEVQYAEADGFSPGSGGANQTWDFSNMDLSFFEIQFSILSPEDGIATTNFPDADFIWLLDEFEAYNYYQVEDNGLTLIGGAFGSPGDVTFLDVFSDLEDGLQLPMTYPDTYEYSSAWTSYFFGISSEGYREGAVEVDGYGTIILPNGTYDNVLRVVITSTTTVSGLTVTETQTSWMLPGQFVPVMVFTTSDDPEEIPSVYYCKRNAINATQLPLMVDYGIRVAGNPVTTNLNLLGTEALPHDLQLRLLDAQGREVQRSWPQSVIATDLLAKGTYYLLATGESGRQVIPFVKS